MFSAARNALTAASRSGLARTVGSTQSRDFCIKAVYVGNLPWATQEPDLKKTFEIFGNIDSIHIPRFEDGRMKGYAFVRYIVGERPPVDSADSLPPSIQEIEQATVLVNDVVEKMNGVDFMGRSLRVSQTKNPLDRANSFNRTNPGSYGNNSRDNNGDQGY
ncbi:putative RNA-binding protein RbpD [Smittium mucronatum]|uniref:Putative RNA-binding protein RbpD n=1 Tax=Smittium mucronatum TaxID=133383 RepID=A0A1R0GPB7_9FUNG|nr:putative RNA-binding protein RbpD [Smittium mucronatum]